MAVYSRIQPVSIRICRRLVGESPVNISLGPKRAVIVCKKCGNQNPDGETFCLSCHSFLEWSGEKIAEPPPPAPPPPPVVAEAEPALLERVKQAVGIDKPKPEPTSSAPDDGQPPPVTTPPPPHQANPRPAPPPTTP